MPQGLPHVFDLLLVQGIRHRWPPKVLPVPQNNTLRGDLLLEVVPRCFEEERALGLIRGGQEDEPGQVVVLQDLLDFVKRDREVVHTKKSIGDFLVDAGPVGLANCKHSIVTVRAKSAHGQKKVYLGYGTAH